MPKFLDFSEGLVGLDVREEAQEADDEEGGEEEEEEEGEGGIDAVREGVGELVFIFSSDIIEWRAVFEVAIKMREFDHESQHTSEPGSNS